MNRDWHAAYLSDPAVGTPIDNSDNYRAMRKRRDSSDARGKVLLRPRTEIVVVPHIEGPKGSWTCVIVQGSEDIDYLRVGRDIILSKREIETAPGVSLAVAVSREQAAVAARRYRQERIRAAAHMLEAALRAAREVEDAP